MFFRSATYTDKGYTRLGILADALLEGCLESIRCAAIGPFDVASHERNGHDDEGQCAVGVARGVFGMC